MTSLAQRSGGGTSGGPRERLLRFNDAPKLTVRNLDLADQCRAAGGGAEMLPTPWNARNGLHEYDIRRDLVAFAESEIRSLAASHHFVTSPQLSPDGRHAAWLGWNHPAMPWDETELGVADVAVNRGGSTGYGRGETHDFESRYLDDRICPSDQADRLVKSLRGKGILYAYPRLELQR